MSGGNALQSGSFFKTAFAAANVLPIKAASGNENFELLLDGTWDYRPLARTVSKPDGSIVDDTSSLPPPGKMPVPSNWHTHGLSNFNGRVRFERDFENARELTSAERAFLIFRGIDYFAEVQLNGALVGRHEGYFQSFEFDVTPNIRRGLNHIAVTVDAPREEPGTVWPEHKRLIKGIFTHWDGKPGGLMKEFGQDGTTAGIWNGAEFLIRRTAWIGGVKLSPVLEKTQSTPSGGDGSFDAKLFITLQLHAIAPGRYSVTAQAGGSQISSQWNLAVGESTVVLVLPMRRPRLWWTWDLGESFAYRCDLLREAHINGVRVCVHVNRNEFYDALDRAGIVTWQDFPLSARSESRR